MCFRRRVAVFRERLPRERSSLVFNDSRFERCLPSSAQVRREEHEEAQLLGSDWADGRGPVPEHPARGPRVPAVLRATPPGRAALA